MPPTPLEVQLERHLDRPRSNHGTRRPAEIHIAQGRVDVTE